jgi:putative intracellular protease/amidase
MGRTVPVETVTDATCYEAIYLPGGHGAMTDLPCCAHLAGLLGEAFTRGARRPAALPAAAGYPAASASPVRMHACIHAHRQPLPGCTAVAT